MSARSVTPASAAGRSASDVPVRLLVSASALPSSTFTSPARSHRSARLLGSLWVLPARRFGAAGCGYALVRRTRTRVSGLAVTRVTTVTGTRVTTVTVGRGQHGERVTVFLIRVGAADGV